MIINIKCYFKINNFIKIKIKNIKFRYNFKSYNFSLSFLIHHTFRSKIIVDT